MASKRGKHTCKCKWWKWLGNAKEGKAPAKYRASERRKLQDNE